MGVNRTLRKSLTEVTPKKVLRKSKGIWITASIMSSVVGGVFLGGTQVFAQENTVVVQQSQQVEITDIVSTSEPIIEVQADTSGEESIDAQNLAVAEPISNEEVTAVPVMEVSETQEVVPIFESAPDTETSQLEVDIQNDLSDELVTTKNQSAHEL